MRSLTVPTHYRGDWFRWTRWFCICWTILDGRRYSGRLLGRIHMIKGNYIWTFIPVRRSSLIRFWCIRRIPCIAWWILTFNRDKFLTTQTICHIGYKLLVGRKIFTGMPIFKVSTGSTIQVTKSDLQPQEVVCVDQIKGSKTVEIMLVYGKVPLKFRKRLVPYWLELKNIGH